MNIKTVTIVGANGTMGRNVAAIFASFGDATVYMVSRTIEKSKLAIQKSCASVKADSIVRKMIPADYSMLKDCVEKSDLIFECVAENLAVKNEITKKIASYQRNHTICCTGTSGLSITALSMNFDEESRKNYLGVHLFNPPYSMTLCEVIPTEFTAVSLLTQMEQYLESTLHRTVVRVKDSPAFLGNRIGFQFINEALQYAEKYKDNGG
ncbi:MAG: 3-hydroxyacyl-CoA dehydrogenase family protein, partial [Ruthenibacterium sp.]